MKKNGNTLAFSRPLFIENLKLHWYLPVLTFLFYFFSGIFPLLMNRSTFACDSLENQNIGFAFVILAMPVIVSCVMMRFYHNREKSFAFISQPYSRSRLFNTQIMTGWLMIVVPVVLTAVLYLLIMGTVTCYVDSFGTVYTYLEEGMDGLTEKNAYTAGDVLAWMFNSIAVITFYYGMYNLAGSLTGNTAVHILGSGVFFGIVPALTGICVYFSDCFILGFNNPAPWVEDLLLKSNPIIALLFAASTDGIFIRESWLYLVFGILFTVVSKYAFNKAKLENIGDSMMFDTVERIVTVVITFVGASVLGMAFQGLFGGRVITISGFFIGTLITLFIVKIIMAKSVKIFNGETLKTLIISLIVIVFFSCFFIYDMGGYSHKIVNRDKIVSVSANGVTNNFNIPYVGENEFGISYDLKKAESIDLVYELNKYVVDNELFLDDKRNNEPAEPDTETMVLYFDYVLKNGGHWGRTYQVEATDTMKEYALKICECDELKSNLTYGDKVGDRVQQISVNLDTYNAKGEWTGNTSYFVTDRSEIKEVLSAYDKDILGGKFVFDHASQSFAVTSYSVELDMKNDYLFFNVANPDSECYRVLEKLKDKYSESTDVYSKLP